MASSAPAATNGRHDAPRDGSGALVNGPALGGPPVAPDQAATLTGARNPRRQRRIRSRNRAIAEWVLAIGLAVVAALVIKTFLVQAFIIPSQSMENTLQVNDRVLVSKFAYDISDVSRGDIIVFKNPARLPSEPAQLIKRVVGLGGDQLEAIDGQLYRNGAPVAESYVKPGTSTQNLEPTVVPEGTVFVLGDNRENSRDSRYIGPIDEDLVIGKAFFRIWPLNRLGFL